MLRVFVVFITLFVCIFTIEAKASNIGYIWFSRSGYSDAVSLDTPIMIFYEHKLPAVNSIISIPKGNVVYDGLNIIEKINNHLQSIASNKDSKCPRMMRGWLAWYFLDGREDEECGLKSIGINQDGGGYFSFSQNKAKVLGYVMFSNELNFVLVESI